MSKGSNENLGFLSRMSELGLRLKQSEDERLALEEKFNKLLSARKSEEEMHLYMLRENYSQLLRQDKMRCDRNDMILQALANVESRASMLTAKTDRLRLLRQHYESYVSRHYPVLKKSVGRHRSVESLISDTSQRSVSSSPRSTSSYSPSPFLRSPSVTRRNSLVVSNSEILDPISYKVPNTSRINLTSHSSRRRLFEDSPKLDKSPDNKTAPKSFIPSRNYEKENVFKNNLPTFIVSTPDQSKVEPTSDSKRTTSGLFLDIPSYHDYTENWFSNGSSGFTKNDGEKTFVRTNHPFKSNISGKYEKLSPTRGSAITFSSKPSLTKPLTKSSSFSIGSSFSKNVSNYFPREKLQTSLIRRPSFVYQTAVSPPLNRFQTPMTNDILYSELPYREKYSFSERTKSPLIDRAISPLSERDISPTVIKSKSPLTVVDDIFKKYLINYDRRYLSDPISESKYGKYLYPLGHYDYTYSEDQRRNTLSSLLESNYDRRSPYFDDDISISSRESVGSNLYSKRYGSHDILFTSDRQQLFHERNMSYFDDKKDWKEWNHYRNRYEYPPTLGPERPETKSSFMGSVYYPSTRENISKEVTKSTSHKFPLNDDLPLKYSYPLNMYGESYEYNTSESYLENPVRSKGSLISRERKISDKQNLTSKDTYRIPQTPKKVSFSNEFLYDDKSDTEVSSNVDEVSTPFDHVKSSEVATEHTEVSSSERKYPDQDIMNLSRESKPYESIHFDNKLGIEESKKPPADVNMKAKIEVSPTKYTEKENSLNSDIKEFQYSNESADTEKYGNSLESNNLNIKESTGEKEKEKIIESQEDNELPNTESNIEQHLTEMPLKVATSNENYSLDSDKREDTVKNIEEIEREGIMGKGGDINETSSTELKNSFSSEPKTTEFIASSQYLGTQNETFTVGENENQSAQNNIQIDNVNVPTEKDIKSNYSADQDSTSQKCGSIENLQRSKPADVDTFDTSKAEHEVGYNEEQQVVYDKEPYEQRGTYDDLVPQQYHDENTYKDPDISEYPTDYSREHYDQHQHQYDKNDPQQEGYVGEEYVQNDAPRQDSTQDVYGPETYGPKDYQQPEVYSGDQYEQQHLDYDEKGFRGSQQNVQDYPQPLPQQQYEDERYINQDQYEQQYKDGDQHYPPENMPEVYAAEQPYKGEYPPEYSQQQYDPNYQDPSQVPQNAPEQYKTDYNTAYQDGSQYGYDQVGSTYDEQFEQHGQQYDHQQQPPYDQYEQQPAEPAYDQYEQQPAEPAYDQYEQEQPAEPAYDQYEQQQPAEPVYDQYEQQPHEPPYDQYEQPHEPPYDQYEQPHEPPYDQYEQQPTEPPYDQYEQQPAELPYDQYKQQPSENYDDQYKGAPDQYGNYNYTYNKTSPVADQTYLGDERPNFVEETQPYDYNEPLQQPYDDVVQHQPYSENVPYEETDTVYPDEQTVYRDDQQVYETSVHAPQNLHVSQNDKLPSDYDYSHSPKPDDSQLPTQQDEPLYEPEAIPYTQADLSFREASEPAPNLNQILESDAESSVAQGPVTHEDSSDFDFSAGQK